MRRVARHGHWYTQGRICSSPSVGRSQAAVPAPGNDKKPARKEHSMMDVLMLALVFGFFALAIGYTYACERL
jgi:hypothetical protein